MLPNKFTMAIAIPVFSEFFVTEGAKAAIAEEPQIAVPKPTNQPLEVGQFNLFARKIVSKRTARILIPIRANLDAPIAAILLKLILKARRTIEISKIFDPENLIPWLNELGRVVILPISTPRKKLSKTPLTPGIDGAIKKEESPTNNESNMPL